MKRQLLFGFTVLILAGCSTASRSESTTTVPATSTSTSTSTTSTSTSTTSTTSTTTTSTSTTTTVPATTGPAVADPDGVPSNDQLVEIVNTWLYRLWEINVNPAAYDVNYICLADTGCSDDYSAQIADVNARGAHVEGGEPGTVNYIRFAEPVRIVDGGFTVSVWTNPHIAGTEVSSNGARDERTDSPEGFGVTLTFAPFPDDAAFPWRAIEVTEDP